MQRTISKTEFTQDNIKAQTKYTDLFIYALELVDGRFAIGQASNAAKAIASVNSGDCKLIPKELQVRHIIGVKEVNETRSLPSVVSQFCRDFGDEKVVCV